MSYEISKSDILSALWCADIDVENGPRWGYSGRGMYGRTCFGFVGTEDEYAEFLFALIEENEGDGDISEAIQVAREFASRTCRDSMGFDTIFYFPGIQVIESE